MSAISGPAAINYQIGPTTYENVFVVDNNDHTLRLDDWNGSGWNWFDVGAPSGVQLGGTPTVINYGTKENVFVFGHSANHGETTVWVATSNGSDTTWNWTPLASLPTGVTIAGSTTAVFNYTTPASKSGKSIQGPVSHEDVFVAGSDGKLYFDTLTGSKWATKWSNLGNLANGVPTAPGEPPGPPVIIASNANPAAISYQTAAGKYQGRVFVVGTDNNVYVDYLNESVASNGTTTWTWAKSWVSLGNPGVKLDITGGVIATPQPINYQSSAGSTPYENVFVTGSNGQEYYDYYNGSTWSTSWVGLGDPDPGAAAGTTAAVINYPPPSGALHEHAFVIGKDGNLYNYYWDGTKWEQPAALASGTPVANMELASVIPAAANYQVGATLHENVFVVGIPPGASADHLYLCYWNGVNWNWVDLTPKGGF